MSDELRQCYHCGWRGTLPIILPQTAKRTSIYGCPRCDTNDATRVETNRMQINIPVAALHLWRICDPEYTRYNLGVIRVSCDSQGVCSATAADGCRACQVFWSESTEGFIAGEILVPWDTFKFALQMLGRRPFQIAVCLDNDVIRIDFSGRQLKFVPPLLAGFPRVDDLFSGINRENAGSHSRFLQPDLLANLLRVAGAVTKSDQRCKIIFADTGTTYVTAEEDGIAFRGAIMPLRSDD